MKKLPRKAIKDEPSKIKTMENLLHIASVHDLKKPCAICCAKFPDKSTLDYHIKSIHENSKYFDETNVQFISYSKCSNWHRILKLSLNFGCLFTFGYSAWTN